uniref:V-set and transmembrane domain containing 2 like n=1 Tax=Cyprinus carpio carpio TaxID=630221 RepID=A0A9J8AX52_CYPCA
MTSRHRAGRTWRWPAPSEAPDCPPTRWRFSGGTSGTTENGPTSRRGAPIRCCRRMRCQRTPPKSVCTEAHDGPHRMFTSQFQPAGQRKMKPGNYTKDSLLTNPLVVKVAGSNISHKLRLSSVKPTDEGTYECRVIDFSDSKLRHHRVRAYLQVERPEGNAAPPVHQGATSQEEALQSDHHKHQPAHHKPGRELRKRSADDSTTDCTESCAL